MILTLTIDGKERMFAHKTIMTRTLKKLVEMQTRINFYRMNPDQMDELVSLIIEVFNDQFTLDEFYDGLPVEVYNDVIDDFFFTVMGGKNKDSKGEEKNEGK